MRKPTMWFINGSNTNQTVQSQKARSLKFRNYKEEEVYYPCSENKGADQLCGYRKADLRLCFRIPRLRPINECLSMSEVNRHDQSICTIKGTILVKGRQFWSRGDNNKHCSYQDRNYFSCTPDREILRLTLSGKFFSHPCYLTLGATVCMCSFLTFVV